MKMNMAFLMIILLCPWAVYAAQAVNVHVQTGKVTEVVFDQPIKKVVKGGAADSVLVEVLDQSLYLLPKTKDPADVFVTSSSGESYPLNLIDAAHHDVRVNVQGSKVDRFQGQAGMDPMDLMKQILLSQEPPGATVIKSNQEIMLAENKIRLRAQIIYDFPHITAYVFTAQNLSDAMVIVPVEQIMFPNLRAVSATAGHLTPQGQNGDQTQVVLIAGK